jgi:hypothetical protein
LDLRGPAFSIKRVFIKSLKGGRSMEGFNCNDFQVFLIIPINNGITGPAGVTVVPTASFASYSTSRNQTIGASISSTHKALQTLM